MTSRFFGQRFEISQRRRVAALLFMSIFSSHSAHSSAGLSGFGVSPPPSTPPAQTGPFPLSTKTTLVIPAGSEFCGIDDIFNNGFEATTFVLSSQLTGGLASPGLTQDITGTGSLSVTITSPSSGASTGEATVDVSGTFTGPINTGITVNGVVGYVANGAFLVPSVPLTSGSNALSATATILTGATASYGGSVTKTGSPSALSIQVNHATGYAPLGSSFTFSIGTLPSGFPVQNVSITFKGTGTPDYSGSSLSGAPTSYTYTQAGLYNATLSVTDTHANTYTAYRPVLVQDLAVQRGMLCDVYGYLKDRLNAQDATNAANAFQSVVKSSYQSLFFTFGSNMPTVAQSLGVVVSGLLGQGFAELFIVRDNVAQQTRAEFPMRLTQGADGVWRISEM